MAPKITHKLTFSDAAVDLINSMEKRLVEQVFPRVASRVVTPIRASIIEKLPDGMAPSDEYPRGSRALQSKKSRDRFPEHMKDNVGRKTIRDSTGVLLIVGVTAKAGQVNFDHGKKAKREGGRVHKLWWVDGVREKYASQNPRKQLQDIPLLVQQEFEGTISGILVEEIRKELAKK